MMDQDLIDLIAAWRGGELEAQRCDELLARLRNDDAFLQEFVNEIRMLGMLKAVQSMEPRWLALQEELGWGPIGGPEEIEEEQEPLWLADAEIDQAPRHAFRWGIAAAIFLGLSAALWAGTFWNRRVPAEVPPGLAIVVKLDRVIWDPTTIKSEQPTEGTLLGPGRLQFGSGQAMLFFLNGVTLTLEGPADVDLVSVDRIFCRKGKLRARVPEGAEGFVVASARSAVVDMGTEFALNVEADGNSRVTVFEGAAEALLLDEKGDPHKTQVVERSQEFALNPSAGKIDAAKPQPEGFVAKPDFKTPSLRLDPSYSSAVLSSRPKGYWRFESLSAGLVPNEVSGGDPLKINGPISLVGAPEENGCAVFKSGAPEQFLTSDGLWELPRRPGHAVEFWFLADGISYASLVGLFPLAETFSLAYSRPYVHAFIVETMAKEQQPSSKPASIRFLRRWPLQADLGTNIFSQNIYTPKRWHHVVAQQNEDRMELFVDGVRDFCSTSEPMHPNVFCRLVVGRRTTNPKDPKDSRPFVGRFDELAIYDHPLTDTEIRQHFELAAPRTASQRASQISR